MTVVSYSKAPKPLVSQATEMAPPEWADHSQKSATQMTTAPISLLRIERKDISKDSQLDAIHASDPEDLESCGRHRSLH